MDLAKLAVIGFVAVIGTAGQSLTLVVLHRLKNNINKALDSTTRRLMVSQAWCDLLLCAVGLPLEMWNMSVGNTWPFTLPAACYYLSVLLYNFTGISTSHMTVMAAWRCTALLAPTTHSRWTKNIGLQACIIATSWIYGCIIWFSFFMASAWRAGYDASVGMCGIMPVDSTSNSETKFGTFTITNGLLGVMVPIALGCVIYAFILAKLYMRQRRTVRVARNAATETLGGGQETTTNKKWSIKSYSAVKVVAWACFVNMALQYPFALSIASGIYFALAANYPLVRLLLDILYFTSFCVTPFVYAASSRDMRGVYKELLLRVNITIRRWWSKKKQQPVSMLEMNPVVKANREEGTPPATTLVTRVL